MYRWHIMDPVCFASDVRVTIQALGGKENDRFVPLADDVASVAYWYQQEPHVEFSPMRGLEERVPH